MNSLEFCDNLFKYQRVNTRKVMVGELALGGLEPIRVQSMTTTNTNDTAASVEQSIRIIEAGGEIVRLTTQGRPEAQNMKEISEGLREKGFKTPIVADVHYNPSAAEIAAQYAEKVRINPGNYTGGAKRFDESADNITQEEWMTLIREKLTPLVKVCKEHHTTLRIGVNHGSLSDRIMAKYGDTPEGMVASCMEYLEALESLDFYDIVISIKASNTRIMVHTVRQLMAAMKSKGSVYPLHLGVTEAGSDAEGRIKSAAGIGALLVDGIGDTIRVSLTEAPEAEIPVAKALVDYVTSKANAPEAEHVDMSLYSPYSYKKRETYSVLNIGGQNLPVVISLGASETGDYDYSYIGGVFQDEKGNFYPMATLSSLDSTPEECFVLLTSTNITDAEVEKLAARDNIVIMPAIINTEHNVTAELRAFIMKLTNAGVKAPVVISYVNNEDESLADYQLKAAADLGSLFIDGLADGVMLSGARQKPDELEEIAHMLLQATQARFSKAEFISCPGCGRTLYDLQSTVQRIKSRLGHLKGLKIGVMGCIVNGIGEMADAHYGYVGAGYDKISLYRGKQLVKKELDQEEALEQLIDIIKQDGLWIEP